MRIVVVDLDAPAPQDGQAVAVQEGEERQHVVVGRQGPDAVEVGLDGGESAGLDRLGVHARDEVVAEEAVEVGLGVRRRALEQRVQDLALRWSTSWKAPHDP